MLVCNQPKMNAKKDELRALNLNELVEYVGVFVDVATEVANEKTQAMNANRRPPDLSWARRSIISARDSIFDAK
jgi:hypothetical protein